MNWTEKPTEPIDSTNLIYSSYLNKEFTVKKNTFYYKDYNEYEYYKLPSVCKTSETEKEFNLYHKYLNNLKKYNKYLERRLNSEMDTEI